MAKGRAKNSEIIVVLEQIDDLEALIEALPTLQRLFNELVDLMIEAKKWQIKHKVSWQPAEVDRAISLRLAEELERLYQIPSCRSLIEKAQEPAIIRLESFEIKKINIQK